MSLTIFANFRIDSEERFLRMKDSFESFKNVTIEKWVINVRGPHNKQTVNFLKENLGGKLYLSERESGKGWFYDSRQMLPNITSEYIFFWIEDHICMQSASEFDEIVTEMMRKKIDYLQYSWFWNGLALSFFESNQKQEMNKIFWLDYDVNCNIARQRMSMELRGKEHYIISACGIFSNKMFKKLICARDPLYRRWPKETPFDFEKKATDVHWLPFRLAMPLTEFFVPIDDDNGIEGSSLQSRGLYPVRKAREEMQNSNIRVGSMKRMLYKIKSIKILCKIYASSSVLKILYYYIRRFPYQF